MSRHRRFTRRPALARKARDELAQRALLGFFIWEPDQNLHRSNLMPERRVGKQKPEGSRNKTSGVYALPHDLGRRNAEGVVASQGRRMTQPFQG